MKGLSKVIMGTTIAIVVLLAIVLGLVLVLLAELYFSLLFRRRNLNREAKPGSTPERLGAPELGQVQDHHNVPSPLSTFYAQGVLEAPRRFLFPKLPSKRERRNNGDDGSDSDVEKLKHGKLCNFLRIQSPSHIRIPPSSLSSLSSPSPSYISLAKPREIQVEEQAHQDEENHVHNDDSGTKGESLMYISNPIYDNDVARASRGESPFETPRCSPSRGEKNEVSPPSSPASLPLSPMKELPEKASSVALSNARSLGSYGSECNSHNNGRSSSSSESPYTSLSW